MIELFPLLKRLDCFERDEASCSLQQIGAISWAGVGDPHLTDE
jgi:hypothetical protein